jgi:rhamnose utilization protein RhaD (predicted bifunctional aldolase and dehydrogenase)
MATQTIAEQIKLYCARIGADPLLVQGAGGNVSWKEDSILWVKASGTCLAEADKKDIFVPVDLSELQLNITQNDFSTKPRIINNSHLKPSIETLLHALMPHKVVAHLHAVEILSHLVRENPIQIFNQLIGNSINWCCVDYFKPGAELAEAVMIKLMQHQDINVVFLLNHGVVIGGENIEEIDIVLQKLTSLLKNFITTPPINDGSNNSSSALISKGYRLVDDKEINYLATNINLSSRLEHEWALFPDHPVFLGENAAIMGKTIELKDLDLSTESNPPFVFDIGKGVYENKMVTTSQKQQLRCYYDVLVRQSVYEKLRSLTRHQVAELINWDAEKYRRSLGLNQN